MAFYVLYVTAIMGYAVLPCRTVGRASLRGAALGLLAYGTYELTNWAVVTAWPAALVPVDMGWGVVLTGVSAAAGRLAMDAFGSGSRGTDAGG